MVTAQGLRNTPWWTIGLATTAVAVLLIPGAADLLVYDRAALARGEVWRLLTAHAVHYSAAHLLNNMLVLGCAAWLVETRYRSDWLCIVALSAVAICAAVFVFEPHIARYAGASGVSLALLTYAALRGLGENRRWRIVCTMVLATIFLKLAAENLFDWQLVNWKQEAGFVTVTLSHAVGACIGVLIWLAHVMTRGHRYRYGVAALFNR